MWWLRQVNFLLVCADITVNATLLLYAISFDRDKIWWDSGRDATFNRASHTFAKVHGHITHESLSVKVWQVSYLLIDCFEHDLRRWYWDDLRPIADLLLIVLRFRSMLIDLDILQEIALPGLEPWCLAPLILVQILTDIFDFIDFLLDQDGLLWVCRDEDLWQNRATTIDLALGKFLIEEIVILTVIGFIFS